MSDRQTPRPRPPRPQSVEDLAKLCAAAALQKKAQDLIVLDVGQLAGYADYFIIATGRSTRQAQAIAENVARVCKKAGRPPMGEEGLREGRWALLDFGDVVVHVFYEPVRVFYDLESLWGDAPRLEFDPQELTAALPPEAESSPGAIVWDD
ncbi:iojap-like protein [Desulfarculus baarsii DSM 2075]|uniref:Ribosomal silencing factor RsfS n=1 Tax=Desulfarculus baarsii (strain ATCC 33931 / DSM 2075 / LMG 7858 / VKM B-1802 / 2st14) TaxID=644282 RepID=E1QJM4_DESB2|nr:ribosome silencing factor [Desulfarculus baarsii]ADK85767.1 iojap-like protein [Desulfarculus baarsii DSM 2075]